MAKPFPAASMVLLVATGLLLHGSAARAAEPLAAPRDPAASAASSPAAVRVGAPRTASRHILVQLHPRADELRFLGDAGAPGVRRLDRV